MWKLDDNADLMINNVVVLTKVSCNDWMQIGKILHRQWPFWRAILLKAEKILSQQSIVKFNVHRAR